MPRDHPYAAHCTSLGLDWEKLAWASVTTYRTAEGTLHCDRGCATRTGAPWFPATKLTTFAQALTATRCPRCASVERVAGATRLVGTTVARVTAHAALARDTTAALDAHRAALTTGSVPGHGLLAELAALRSQLARADRLATSTTPWALYGPVFRTLFTARAELAACLAAALAGPAVTGLLARHAIALTPARWMPATRAAAADLDAAAGAATLAAWVDGAPLRTRVAADPTTRATFHAALDAELAGATRSVEPPVLVHLGVRPPCDRRTYPPLLAALFDDDGTELRWLPAPLAAHIAALAQAERLRPTVQACASPSAAELAATLLAAGLTPAGALATAAGTTA